MQVLFHDLLSGIQCCCENELKWYAIDNYIDVNSTLDAYILRPRELQHNGVFMDGISLESLQIKSSFAWTRSDKEIAQVVGIPNFSSMNIALQIRNLPTISNKRLSHGNLLQGKPEPVPLNQFLKPPR
ncbi:unnamed protein product [Lupinus luteus]|uniref:Uncharacterized protein n=1 Tax=Lupinus luteus TaxID=3873 RepID=A0AAV1YIP6_LUPLU